MRGNSVSELYRLAMIRELAANAYKGGWLGRGAKAHLRDLEYHVAKLRAAVRSDDTVRILEYAADVGNHAMFLAHETGALETDVRAQREGEPDFVPAKRRTYAWLLLHAPRKAILGLVKPQPPEAHVIPDDLPLYNLREITDEGAVGAATERPPHVDRLTGIFT